jgi:hypothetical protein
MNPGSCANAQDDVLKAFSNTAFNIELALSNNDADIYLRVSTIYVN